MAKDKWDQEAFIAGANPSRSAKRKGWDSTAFIEDSINPEANLREDFSPPQAAPTRTSRTTGEAALDLGVGVVKGVAQGIHSIADFGAAITPGFEDDLKSGPIDTPLNWAEDKLQALKSEVVRVKEQKLSSMIADPNVSVSEVASYFASNLSDLGAQVGIESLGAMAIGAGVTGALAKANAIRNIAAGSKLGAAAVGSIGEAMQIGGDVYRSTEGNVAAGGAGALMGVLTSIATPGNVGGMIAKRFARGATGEAVEGVEEVATKGFIGRTLGETGARGAVARAGTAVAAEGTQEFGQELLQSAIEQQSLTGEVDWTQASKKGVIGAMVGGPMGGGLHPVLGEGGVGTRQEINAARANLAAAEQAAAANPTDPTAQSNVDSARANLAAVSTTPEQASGAADAAVQAQTAEILSERTETVEQAVAGFSVQQDTSSDLRTGAQVAGEAQRAAAAASYNPETAEEDTGVAPRVSTAPVSASTASPITPDTPSATPSPTIEAPAPARRITNAQMIVGLGDNNPDIARVAAHVVGQNPITNIATQVARMSGDLSAGTPITRPSTVPQAVWDEFVADAQRVTGIMVPFRLSGPTRTVRDHLQEVFRTGSNPGRVIAQTLLASNNPNLGVNVEPFTATDMVRRPEARGYMLPNFQGEAEVIRMNPSSGTESAFLHETLHAITIRWLDHVSTTDPLYVELKTLMERVRAEADSRGVTHYGTHPGEQLSERRKMAEFLAEATNRAVFQTFLDSIQVESNRTGWDTFVAWVGRLLGTTNARAISALDLALRVNQDVIDASARMSRGEPAATPEPAPAATPAPAPAPVDPYDAARQVVVDLGWEDDAITDFENLSDEDLQGVIGHGWPTAAEFARQIIARRAAQPADPYAAARQAVVDLGWEDDLIADFESRSDEDLQGIIDTARRPTAAEFARQIIARRAAQPAPTTPDQVSDFAQAVADATPAAPSLAEATTRFREVGRQNGTSQNTLNDILDMLREFVGVSTEADVRTEIAELESDNDHARADVLRALFAERNATPTQTPVEAARTAYLARQAAEGVEPDRARGLADTIENYDESELRRITSGAYWPQAVTYAQAILDSRAATPAPTTTPAPAAATPAPAADEGTRLRQALITYYRDDYGSSNPEALATSLDNADAAQLGALSTNQGVAPAVAAYARYIMQSRGAPLTSAQRGARTRAQNAFMNYLAEYTRMASATTDANRQSRADGLINNVTLTSNHLQRHPSARMTNDRDRAIRSVLNSYGRDAGHQWMTDRINAHLGVTTPPAIPPQVQAGISDRVGLQSDFAQAQDALDQRGWPMYEGSGLSLTRVEAMTDPELSELRRWAAGNGFPRTQALAEALINVRANAAGRLLPYPRFTAGAAPASTPTSTPTSTPATPFASRARAMLGTGKLDRLAQFWRDVIHQRGMKTASDLVNIDDLVGQDTQATADELARRYNQALHQRAVEWARANNQPDPPYQDMIVAIENNSPGTARGRVGIKTRGLARRGNPFLPQMTSPNPRFTWREHTLGGAGSSFDTAIHATGLEETPGSSEIFYTLASDMARIKGNQGFYSDTILSTVNNLRRQVQSTMISLRTNNPRLINPLTGPNSRGPQGMEPDIWNAATDEEKIGLNILRYVESVIGKRGGNAVSLGNIFKNIRALPDGTFVDSSTNQSLTYADIERMVNANQTFVRDQGTGGVGITAATFGILGNTVAEMLERDANADIAPFVQAAVDIGRRNAGWLFSQDAARDIQGELESLMAENAMPNTSAERRAEINAEIRALQDERAQAPESDDFDFDAADRMFNELGPASEAARAFAAAGAGRATRPVDTNSAEFKRWFGDSKVVDADGKPLRVYHGTAADISAFEFPDEARSMGGLFGHFFTSDPAFAAKYGNAVMPTYLSIKNPKVVSVDELGAMQGSRAGERERRWAIEDGYDGAVTSDGKVWMAFEPTQIKSAIGNTGAFSDTNPNILYSMDAVPSDAEVANSPASRIAITTAPVSPPSRNEIVIAGRRKNRFFERLTEVFREKVQDKDVTLRRVMQTINDTSTIDAMDRFAGLVQSSLENLVSRPMADIEAALLPLGEGARAAFEEYLKMRHAREYNAHVASISPLQFDAYGNRMSGFGLNEHPASGTIIIDGQPQSLTNNLAAEYMAREHPQAVLDAARLYDKMTRSLQDFAVETGLEDQATINTWRAMFPNYTPFRRVLDMEENLGTGSGFSVREGISRRALGSSAEIVDPLVATLEQAARIVERGEKARVAQAMLNTARTADIPKFKTRGGQIKPMWKIDTTPNILTTKRLRVYNILDNNGQIMRNDSGIPMEFYNGGEARAYARLLTQPDPRKVFTVSDTGFHERVVTAHNPAYINKDNVVIIPENGENTMLVFDEDSEDAMAMARNFKNLDTVQVSAFLSAPNAFSRWVVGTSTGYNPMFAPINFIRDIFSSAVNINSANIPGWSKADSVKLMANATKNIGPLLVYLQQQHAARHSNNTSMPVAAPGSPAAIMERAKAAGGLTGVRESFTTYEDSLRNVHRLFGENVTPPADPRVRNDRANRIANGITEASDAFGRFLEGDVRNRVAKRLSDLPVAIGNLNNAFELATRVAAFDGAVRKFEAAGMSRAEAEAKAAVVSKNVSVNFNRRGQMTGFFNALYPFFNAAMQGSARLAELLFKKEQVKNADGEYEQRTKLTPLGKKVAMAFPALGAFQALLLAAAGFDDDQPPDWVRSRNFVIPLGGKEFALIPMPLGLNALFNMGRSATDAFLHPENAAKHIRGAFTEIPAAFNPLGNTPNALLQVTPAVGDIPVGLLMNRDAFNRPIFKEDRDPRRPTPGWTRNKEGTSEWAIGIAKGLNNTFGGNEYRPGFFNFTGDQIEYFFGQLGGGVAREAIKAEQFAFGSQTSEDRPWYKVPLFGKFRGSAGDSAAVRDQLYTTSAELNVLNAEYKGLKEDRKFAEAAVFLKENPEVRLHDDFDRYFKAEGKVRKERTELQREGKGEAVAEINTDLRTKGEKLIAEVERIRSAAR